LTADENNPVRTIPVEAKSTVSGAPQDRPDRQHAACRHRRISVLLVDPMRLTRDCLAQLLRSGATDIDVQCMASLEEATPGPEAPDIILINAMPRQAFLATVEQRAAQVWPGAPVLVIYDEDEAFPQGESIRNGSAGVFPASLGVTILIATIRVILAHSTAGLGLPGTRRE
jgi:DNA-binding NarL/FixJ family response regulator